LSEFERAEAEDLDRLTDEQLVAYVVEDGEPPEGTTDESLMTRVVRLPERRGPPAPVPPPGGC